MKTKEEILEHLSKNGYQHDEVRKIAGYLLGSQITEKGEKVNYTEGDGTFDEFFEWVNEVPRNNVFLDIANNLDFLLRNPKPKGSDISEKTINNIRFLFENKEYLQECMERKEEAEVFLEDVTEVLKGLNKSLKSIFRSN